MWKIEQITAEVWQIVLGFIATVLLGWWRFVLPKKNVDIEGVKIENRILKEKVYSCEDDKREFLAAFNLAYNQYEMNLTNDQMSMLRDLKRMLDR